MVLHAMNNYICAVDMCVHESLIEMCIQAVVPSINFHTDTHNTRHYPGNVGPSKCQLFQLVE